MTGAHSISVADDLEYLFFLLFQCQKTKMRDTVTLMSHTVSTYCGDVTKHSVKLGT